jgi:hypothetical protein
LHDHVIANWPAGARCLAILGEDRHEDWLDAIAASGRPVRFWTVYRAAAIGTLTDTAREALAAGSVAAVLHYSPRQAGLFLAAAGDLAARAQHIALSEAVATPLRAAGLTVSVANAPNEDSLFATLEAAIAALPASPAVGQGGPGPTTDGPIGSGVMSKTSQKRRGVTIEATALPPSQDAAAQDSGTRAPAAPDAGPDLQPFAAAETMSDAAANADPKPADPKPVPDAPAHAAVPPTVTRIVEQRTSPVALGIAALLGGGIAALGMLSLPKLLPQLFAAGDSRIAGLETRLGALEAGQSAASRAMAESRTAFDGLAKRLDGLAAAPPTAAVPAGLMERLARLEAAEANANRQRGEIGDAARREAQLLTERLTATEQALKAQQGASPAAQAALRLSIYDRIRASLAAGQSFAPEIAALQKDGVSAESLRPLAAIAERAPTRLALADEVRRQRRVLAEDTAATARSFGDRLMSMADSLVQVRRVDGPADQPTPAGLTLALEQALTAGETAKAAATWNRLPEPARRATARLGADLAALAAAEQALAALTTAELASVGRR